MYTPNLGFITPSERTQEQNAAHELACGVMVKHSLPCPTLAKGDKFCLYDFWKKPEVVSDVGLTFKRFHQLTGSCVATGGCNALFSSIAAQRMSANPIKAFIPFWLSAYAMSRHYMGDDGQGEGSLGSTFAKALTTDGIYSWENGNDPDGLPDYANDDGITVTESIEMKWSSYRNPDLAKVVAKSREHLVGGATEATDTQGIKSLVLNGYGTAFACNNYIGNASVKGSGANACVMGRWDGSGGHQQSILGYWEHPDFGPLYWAQNNWAGNTYPKDPAGGPDCGCWVTEANVTAALRLDSEVYGYSRINWFPAQPELLNWVY